MKLKILFMGFLLTALFCVAGNPRDIYAEPEIDWYKGNMKCDTFIHKDYMVTIKIPCDTIYNCPDWESFQWYTMRNTRRYHYHYIAETLYWHTPNFGVVAIYFVSENDIYSISLVDRHSKNNVFEDCEKGNYHFEKLKNDGLYDCQKAYLHKYIVCEIRDARDYDYPILSEVMNSFQVKKLDWKLTRQDSIKYVIPLKTRHIDKHIRHKTNYRIPETVQ